MKTKRSRCVGLKACGVVLAAVALLSAGCEWESSGDEGSWSDAVSWANFAGVYRSGSDARPLVANFSLASGGVPGTGSDTSQFIEHPVVNQAAFDHASPFTTVSGTINFMNRGVDGWYLKAGSVDITFTGTSTGPVGGFSDNGSGVLAGNYAQVPGGPSFAATGTIDYDTGAWSITLSPTDPFVEIARITYSYVVLETIGSSVVGGGGGGGNATPPTSYAWIYTLDVQQTGNQLRFVDNRGFTWEGRILSMTTPGGDSTGKSAGDVVGAFEVTGTTDSRFKITGSFGGVYTVAAAAGKAATTSASSQLTQRRIQGIWMEPTGNGDLYGQTVDGNVQTVADAAPPAN